MIGWDEIESAVRECDACRLCDEAEACLPYLRAQVALVRPRIIILLGATAARNAISPDIRITRDRGAWFEKDGVYLIITYHPSALLRDTSLKRAAWDDFKSVKDKAIELGIVWPEHADISEVEEQV